MEAEAPRGSWGELEASLQGLRRVVRPREKSTAGHDLTVEPVRAEVRVLPCLNVASNL